jgi:hypothetical protein
MNDPDNGKIALQRLHEAAIDPGPDEFTFEVGF